MKWVKGRAPQQEQIQMWKEHFKNLLGNSSKVTDKPITKIINAQLDIRFGHFTQEELNIILTKIKSRKAAGFDKISLEVWKTRKFDDLVLGFSNTVYRDGQKATSSPSTRKVSSESPRTTEA